MSEDNRELVARETEELEQMNLALEGEKLFIDYSERPFQYTGERFLRDHPARAKIAIKLIALGFGNEPIAKKVHADHRTIRQLRYHPQVIGEVEKQKDELRAVIFPGMMLSAERAIELLPNVQNARDAAVTHGIFRDTFMQVSGIPTAKIEISGHVDIDAKIEHLIKTATEEMKAAKARLVGEASDTDALQIEEGAPA
jgi:hypothetical protein